MWSSQMQVDTWLNLGDGTTVPDEWVRVSAIERIRMVEGAERAVVVLKLGTQTATAFTAQVLMDRIAKANKYEP